MMTRVAAVLAESEKRLSRAVEEAVRALGRQSRPAELEFMAISSYGQRATSSGVVRILKDLDRDIAGRHVIVVEDIVDSGLTLNWLLKYLQSKDIARYRSLIERLGLRR